MTSTFVHGRGAPLGRDLQVFRCPESVAIVGCQPMPSAKVGAWLLHNLLMHAPDFAVYPVNPDYKQINGRRCYPSIARLPISPRLVLVAASPRRSLEALRDAEAAGALAAIVFGSKESGDDELAFEAELREFARGARMAVCGPGSNGFFNVTDAIACTSAPFAAKPGPPRGDVAIVSHSGALVTSLVARLARNALGLSYACAVGNSVGTSLPDFIQLVASDEVTRTILVYVEGLADRGAFFASADAAVAAGKRVVALKAGRSLEGRAAVQAHTGVLAGAGAAFEAVCERHGIIVAADFDEFATLPVFLRRRSTDRRTARRLGIASSSGAIGVMLTDVARSHDFQVPPLNTSVTAVDSVPGIPMTNPLDLTVHDGRLSHLAIRALAEDPGMDTIVFGIQAGPAPLTHPVHQALAAVAQSGKDVIVWSAGGTAAVDEPILAAAGIPVVPSAGTLFSCLRKVVGMKASGAPGTRPARHELSYRAVAALQLLRQVAPGPVPAEVAWQLLVLYGIPALVEYPVTFGDALSVAERLGYPVVAKLTGPHLPHRSDRGFVKLGLRTADAVLDAVRELAAAGSRNSDAPTQVVLQKQARPGSELILAARADSDAGPHVVAGFGGVFAEVLSDVAIGPAPMRPTEAQALVEGLRGAPLLIGAHGTGAKDLAALRASIGGMSELAADLCGPLAFIEINPLIVGEAGVAAVDVLASAL